MSKIRRTTAIAVFTLALALPAAAAPHRDDDPIGAIKQRIVRAIKSFTHIFVPTPNDDPQPPKP